MSIILGCIYYTIVHVLQIQSFNATDFLLVERPLILAPDCNLLKELVNLVCYFKIKKFLITNM